MEEKKGNQFIDADRYFDVYEEGGEDYEPSPEVLEEFDDAAKQTSGCQLIMRVIRKHHDASPKLSGGDIDAALDRADAGEETVDGSPLTPDQDVVDRIGEGVGLTYEDNEPLDAEKNGAKRDERRWELDPASYEGHARRVSHEEEYEWNEAQSRIQELFTQPALA